MRISDWSSDVCSSDLGITSEVAAKALASPVVAAPGGSAAAASTTTATGVPLRLTGLVTAATSSGQPIVHTPLGTLTLEIGRASCRERVCPYVSISVVAVQIKKKKI